MTAIQHRDVLEGLDDAPSLSVGLRRVHAEVRRRFPFVSRLCAASYSRQAGVFSPAVLSELDVFGHLASSLVTAAFSERQKLFVVAARFPDPPAPARKSRRGA